MLVAWPLVVEAQEIKDVEHVSADFLVISQQAKVRVQVGGFFVEIAGTDVAVVCDVACLLPLDQDQLAVHLQARDTKHHLNAEVRQTLGPVDVGLFIKACLQLDHRQNPLSIVDCINESITDAGVASHPIQANPDAFYLGVQGRRLKQVDDVVEGVVGVVQQHVLLADLLEKTAFGFQSLQGDMCERSVLQVPGADIGKIHEILGIVVTTTRDQAIVFTHVEMFGQEPQQAVGHRRVVNEAYGFCLLASLQADLHLLYQTVRYACIDLQLRIPGEFDCVSG